MNLENRNRVIKFIDKHNTSPLTFLPPVQKCFSALAKEKNMVVVLSILLVFTKLSPSFCGEKRETREGRNRSVLDIWRHLRSIKEKVDIFEVMHNLHKLSRANDCCDVFVCSQINRRVFVMEEVDTIENEFNENYPFGDDEDADYYSDTVNADEFGLWFSDWRDI